MKSFIIPYIRTQIPNFTNSEVMELFDRSEKDNTLESIFFDGSVKSREEFLSFMNKPGVQLYVVYVKGDTTPMGFIWLDQFMYKTAHGHFCAFSEYWGDAYVIGHEVLLRLLTAKNQKGEYVLDAIYGFVPEDNKLALKATELAGFKTAGTLPYAFYYVADNKSHHGVMIYYTRDEISEEELKERG